MFWPHRLIGVWQRSARSDLTIAASTLGEEAVMNDEPKAAALARAEQSLGVHGVVVADVLGRIWDESFEQGRLAALDELQDRLCVCMK